MRRARRLGVVEKSLAADVADQHVDPSAQLQPRDQHHQQARAAARRCRRTPARNRARCVAAGRRNSDRTASPRETASARAASKSKRDTCTEPEGSCTMPAENGFACRCCSQVMLCGRRSLVRDGRAVRPAHQDGQQPLVGGHLGEIAAQSRLVALLHELGDRLLHGVHHQLRAHLDVGAEPFGQQSLDVRQARRTRPRTRRAPPATRNAT